MHLRTILANILAELTKATMLLSNLVRNQMTLIAAVQRLEAEQQRQAEILEEIRAELVPGEAVGFRITVYDVETGEIQHFEEEEKEMDLRLRKKMNIALVPVDVDGNETTLDGPVNFQSSSPDALIVTPGADGLSAQFEAQGPAEADHILSFSGDGDLGPGVKTITGTLEIHTKAGDAASFRTNVTEVPEA